jgi:hypothetical protein
MNGQIEPLICTLGIPESHEVAHGADLTIVKGHRRFAAARRAGVETVPAVVLSHASGEPLTTSEQIAYWLTATHGGKSPTAHQTLVGVLLWYREWTDGPSMSTPARLTQRDIARLFHVSNGTVNRAKCLSEEPDPIVNAVVAHAIPLEAVFKLIELVPDQQRRCAIVEEVRATNVARRFAGGAPLTVRDILCLADGETRECADDELDSNAQNAAESAAERAYDSVPSQARLRLTRAPAPTECALWPSLQVVALLTDDPQASDEEILAALTRDLCAWFQRLDPGACRLKGPLLKPLRMLRRPTVEGTLIELVESTR